MREELARRQHEEPLKEGVSMMTPRPETASTRIDRDGLLVKALQSREPAAAELLVTTYGDRAYRLAKGIAGSAQDAEEVVQDALWTVVRKIDTFRGEAAFSSWFYRIVVNAAYQKLRHRPGRRDEISFDEVLPLFHENGQQVTPIADWSPSVDDPSRETELRMALTASIEELPPDYRAVLILHDVEGLSNVEVAESLGITVANAKSRTHRARLFLRKRLGSFMSDATVGVTASA
jgi:RNA polymerase sigma-70 factor (ECF subfamily)